MKKHIRKTLLFLLVSLQILSCCHTFSYIIERNASCKYGTLQEELKLSIDNVKNNKNTSLSSSDIKILQYNYGQPSIINYTQIISYFIVVILVIRVACQKGDDLF